MATYVLTLRPAGGMSLINRVNQLVIRAESEADARSLANSFSEDDPQGIWNAAELTEVLVFSDFIDFSFRVAISPLGVEVISTPDGSVTGLDYNNSIDSGGTGYTVGDILTLVGGTFIRPATYRVNSVSGGAVTFALQLVDPGLYSVLPAKPAPTSGGGTGATILWNYFGESANFETMLASLVDNLNAQPEINGASVDASFSGFFADGKLVVADSGDALGDQTLTVELLINNQPITSMIKTITHQGSSGDELSFTFSTPGNVFSPTITANNFGAV